MTSFQRFPIVAAGALLLLGSAAYAQSVISAKSGLIHDTEGDVFLQNKLVELTGAKFADMKNGDVLRSEEGRAEVLLIPGSILWMAENSSIKMVSNRIAHTVVEVLSGSVVVECAQVNTGTEVVLNFKDTTVEFTKKGMVRIDTDPAAVKVYSGDAIVTRGNESLTLKEGRQTLLSGVLQPEKFDNKVGDSFYRWAARRDASLAAASIAAAQSLNQNGSRLRTGMWGWNPLLSMFSYIPGSGRYTSPFGYSYYSPYAVGGVYESYYYGGGRYSGYSTGNAISSGGGYNAGLGYSTASRGSSSYSSPASSSVSSGPAAAAPAASAGRGAVAAGGGGASRGDGGGGGRGGR